MYNDPLPIFDVAFAHKRFFPIKVNTEPSLQTALKCFSVPLKWSDIQLKYRVIQPYPVAWILSNPDPCSLPEDGFVHWKNSAT